MPKSTFVEMPKEEQSQMLAALRRARYGYLLALHILLLCAAGRTPTAIADVLFCSRSSVYRAVRAYRAGTLGLDRDDQGQFVSSVRTTVRVPTLRRWLLALLEAPPRAYGWGRTRWSCATLALTLQAKRGITVSAETLRRWVHEVGWVWKRAKLGAKDDDPHRVARLALVTILQFREQLSDRQAAGAVRARIDGKYLLGLELSDAGFDFSVLSEFRDRLLAGRAEALLLDKLLERCRALGLRKARGQQRTDSTHVLAAIRVMNRLELVAETLRAALNELATTAPAWLQSIVPAEWYERYGKRIEDTRLPREPAKREAYAQMVGEDGFAFSAWGNALLSRLSSFLRTVSAQSR
jgi:transposase